jgi:hypothetical protein
VTGPAGTRNTRPPAHLFSASELAALQGVKDNLDELCPEDAAWLWPKADSVAGVLCEEYPELPKVTLAHLMANVAVYVRQFGQLQPDASTEELAGVFAAAAIRLASNWLVG